MNGPASPRARRAVPPPLLLAQTRHPRTQASLPPRASRAGARVAAASRGSPARRLLFNGQGHSACAPPPHNREHPSSERSLPNFVRSCSASARTERDESSYPPKSPGGPAVGVRPEDALDAGEGEARRPAQADVLAHLRRNRHHAVFHRLGRARRCRPSLARERRGSGDFVSCLRPSVAHTSPEGLSLSPQG